MQSEYDDKVDYKTKSEPRFDLESYDPCDSGYDITEKDLAVLLKEEKAKLEESEDLKRKENEKTGQAEQTEAQTFISQSNIAGNEPDGAVGFEEEQSTKKRICRKPIKNPFFTNRFDFSSGLPLPPPAPPPQFLPLVEEKDSKGRIICPKRKRRCKSKTNVGCKDGKSKRGEEEDGRSKRGEDEDGRSKRGEDEDIWGGKDTEGRSGRGSRGSRDGSLGGSEGSEGDTSDQEGRKRKGKDDDDTWGQDGKGRRKCKKRAERVPCRKKVSEVSLTLQPRQIPALQRDLPPTCPRNIPEVERQILMGCKNTCQVDCSRKKSKKKK